MTSRFICLFVFGIFFFVSAGAGTDNAAAQTTPQKMPMKQYSCAKDRGGTLYCQRIAPSGKHQGQEGVYGDTVGGKSCKWKCKIDKGLEICQAGGTECDGRTPPHWR